MFGLKVRALVVELLLPPVEISGVTRSPVLNCSPDVVYSASYHNSLRHTTVKASVDG